jgi:hypothetical protein
MHEYTCQIGHRDQLVAYATDAERKGETLFAMVSESDNGQTSQKISILLNKTDAVLLRDQLNQFIGEPSKATIVAGIIRLYQQNNFDTDVLDQLMAICGEQ